MMTLVGEDAQRRAVDTVLRSRDRKRSKGGDISWKKKTELDFFFFNIFEEEKIVSKLLGE